MTIMLLLLSFRSPWVSMRTFAERTRFFVSSGFARRFATSKASAQSSAPCSIPPCQLRKWYIMYDTRKIHPISAIPMHSGVIAFAIRQGRNQFSVHPRIMYSLKF